IATARGCCGYLHTAGSNGDDDPPRRTEDAPAGARHHFAMPATSRSSLAAAGIPAGAPLASNNGLADTADAFAIWGLFPIYLRALALVPALQLVAHRVAWACLLVLGWMAWRGQLAGLREVLARRGLLLRLSATAVLISINWLAYVWAVANGRVVETSL